LIDKRMVFLMEQAVGAASGRWMGVFRSGAQDSQAAAEEAVRGALRGDDAKLVIVLAGIDHDPKALVVGAGTAAPGVPMVGCSTHGEIGPGGPTDDTVIAIAIGGPGFSVATARATQMSGRQRAAGAEVAACARAVEDRPYKVMLMLTNGLSRDQEEVLRGAFEVVGATVPLVGGAAGDAWRNTGTFQLFGDEHLTDGVVAACIASDAPIGIGVSHGWQPVGEPMIVTQAGDGRVYALDDKPALDAYLSCLGAPADIRENPAAITRYAARHPLGIQRRRGMEVRDLSNEIDLDGRSIGGGGELTAGSLVYAMEGDETSILAAPAEAGRTAMSALGGRPLLGMLAFSCSAIRGLLGDEGIVKEGEVLAAQAAGAPFAGFYTYGEIARVRNVGGFHNQTIVVLALS
jgi:hypothetical protein